MPASSHHSECLCACCRPRFVSLCTRQGWLREGRSRCWPEMLVPRSAVTPDRVALFTSTPGCLEIEKRCMRTCEVHVHVPAHSESIALQSEVHEGTLVYSLKDRVHMRWAHPVPHATERMHTCQCACVHTRAHRVPRTFSSCMWLQQCTRFCRCTLDFRGFCNGVHEMCTMRGVGSSVMQTTFLQARLPRVRSLTEKRTTRLHATPP